MGEHDRNLLTGAIWSFASVWVVGGAPETETGAAHHTEIIQLFPNL